MNTFFDFSERHKTALINFLQDALAKNNEFEIRFGKFYHDRQKKQSTFDSNFDVESFYNLKKMLKNIPHKEIITTEFIYKNPSGYGNIKKIINTIDNTETILLKNTLKKYDIYDYDLRFSTSYEKTTGITLDTNLEHELVRNKKRTSYIFDYGHLDLTIVSQTYKESNDGRNRGIQQKYEVELEITKNDMPSILSLIGVILQTRQDNFYIISEFEKRNIIDEYKKLVNAPYFIGAQPETLHKDKITTLYKQNYSVTDKADGDRAFMYIDNSGKIYFIDNNLNRVYKTDLSSSKRKENYFSSIIDGEIVKHENKIHFLAFDVMFYNGVDLRGNEDYKLKTRLNRLNDIVKTINNSNYYNIEMKKFYYTNVFMGSKIIMDTIKDKFYANDGLIFTPVNEAYPKKKKWTQLLKWKPSELNSIDFYSVKISSENGIGKWQLYVQGQNKTKDETKGPLHPEKTEKVLFDIEKLCGKTNSQIITYETTFPENTIDPSTDEFYQTNTVIEYKYENEKFVPMRTRWDKTVNPRKHGNFSQVACDIWNNIHNPIEKELLFQFTVNSNKDFFFERMRKFHNKVKEYLYNKYCKDIDNLLELCSGKGGDLHKWLYNNVKNVCGYDISEKNILECQRRINSLKNNNINTSFYKLDLTKNNSDEIIYNNNQDGFNVVSCQFGIHYFFQSESNVNNIVKILDKSLIDNGYFIITFLDNIKIDNLFENKNIAFYEEDGEIMYLIEREEQKEEQRNLYGNKLQITLNGNNILGEGSNEWIINFENFKNLLESKGYKCIETELFENIYDTIDKRVPFDTKETSLTNCEKNISFLNRYCVFQKSSNV
jgi:SAM-dependent methyltransferase